VDERKTNPTADPSDEHARSADAQPSAAAIPASPSAPPGPLQPAKTMIWRGGVAEKLTAATSGEPPAPARASVVIGRTVIASGEPRPAIASADARGSSLGKTQIWRTGLGNPPHDSSSPARSLAETIPSSRHSAELWAAQLPRGPHTMITTLQQPIEASAPGGVEPPQDESQTRPVDWPARAKQAREAWTEHDESTEPSERTKRRALRRPGPRALHAIRVAAVVVIVASLGAIAGSLCGGSAAKAPGARAVTPAARIETARSASTEPVQSAAAAQSNSHTAISAAAERGDRGIRAASPARGPGSAASPRAALDALIAGDRSLALVRYRALAQHDPGQPAYGAAAAILAEIEQRDAASRRDN